MGGPTCRPEQASEASVLARAKLARRRSPQRLHDRREIVLPNGHRFFPVGALFACRRVGGQPRPDGRESTAVRYFAQDELPPMPPHYGERVAAAFAAGPLPASL